MSDFPCPSCDAPQAEPARVCARCSASLVVLGKYQLTALFGEGGMGRVYGAREQASGREVAVKVLTLRDGVDWSARELFAESTRMLMGLRHPGLPAVHDFAQDDDGRLWLVREPFGGGTLEERVRRDHRRLSHVDFRSLLTRLLRVFAYLQDLVPPVLHRDVKPANIMFRTASDWEPVLVDFDTASAPLGGRTGSTIVGTLGYAAPEQLGADYGPSSDLYALGVSLLFVATHQEPHEMPRKGGRFDVEAMLGVFDPNVRAVLRKLVEPEPGARYARAVDALADLSPPLPPPARPAPRDESSASARSPSAALSVGLFALLLSVGGAVVMMNAGSAPEPQRLGSVSVDARDRGPSPLSKLPSPPPLPGRSPVVVGRSVPDAAVTQAADGGSEDGSEEDDEDEAPARSRRSGAPRKPPVASPPVRRRPASVAARPEHTFARDACAGLLSCYDQHRVYGAISGRVVMEVAASGAVESATYGAGRAPAAVQECLVAKARSKRIDGFWGDPGQLSCEFLGNYVPGAPVVSLKRRFTRARE